MTVLAKPLIGIVADDLTSAADGTGPFVGRGASAQVGRRFCPSTTDDVLSVDCGSRAMSADQAAEAVCHATQHLADSRILLKTVDSTLRGNVRAELAAALSQSRRQKLVFAPAFPAAGRITRNGIQFVGGTPVSETVYGRDPIHPARTSTLKDLLPDTHTDVILLDAETQQELDEKVRSLKNHDQILWAGSPGLAEALAKYWLPQKSPTRIEGTDGRIVVVVGTANPASHKQAAAISSFAGVTVLTAPTERQTSPVDVLRAVTTHASAIVGTGNVGALIATGGDTMEAILDELNIQQFEMLGELEAGFPLARAHLPSGKMLLLAMKAGGFGDSNTLLRAVERLSSTPLHPELLS